MPKKGSNGQPKPNRQPARVKVFENGSFSNFEFISQQGSHLVSASLVSIAGASLPSIRITLTLAKRTSSSRVGNWVTPPTLPICRFLILKRVYNSYINRVDVGN
ncbi:hypothetical protein NEUTE2DRAFT_72987 [Neurospora tetrasperma FGSC 2509]|nr:hypothetical protein NEUTE2DRAFT_72987 [Neurospora tetrasperma FGSC 2509]